MSCQEKVNDAMEKDVGHEKQVSNRNERYPTSTEITRRSTGEIGRNSNRMMTSSMGVLILFTLLFVVQSFRYNRTLMTNESNMRTTTIVSTPNILQNGKEALSSSSSSSSSCLSLDFDEDMDHFLSKYKQVWIIMPAKAAGSTFKLFAKQCMGAAGITSFADIDNVLVALGLTKKALVGQLEVPSLVASHIFSEKNFCDVMKNAGEDTLVVYSYREETSRLLSSIKYVLSTIHCRHRIKGVTFVNDACHVQEGVLIDAIIKKTGEIGVSSTQILTCQSYECIKDNGPNLIFLHYKQADQLQKLLAKHYCPAIKEQFANAASHREKIYVVLESQSVNDQVVSLDDWLSAKRSMLDMSLLLKTNVSCQAITRDIEHELLTCPNEAVHISGRSYDNEKIQFSF